MFIRDLLDAFGLELLNIGEVPIRVKPGTVICQISLDEVCWEDLYLHQAIVDLASIFSPALCLVDATTILTQGGPFGPGRVTHPNKVYAGKDMVALDALCCDLLNVNPREVLHIQLAHELEMVQMNLAQGAIKHVRL